MFFDTEFDRLFRRLAQMDMGGLPGADEDACCVPGPRYYGRVVTVGPDGRPVVKEYGNVRPGPRDPGAREPAVDTIVDEKEKVVKLIAEMPGVEKADVKIVVDGRTVDLSAERDGKKYRARVAIERKFDGDGARATYKNGILQIVFKLLEDGPAGKTVEVE